MKKRRKKSNPRLPTSGKACMTVSSRARTDLAIFSSFRTIDYTHRSKAKFRNAYTLIINSKTQWRKPVAEFWGGQKNFSRTKVTFSEKIPIFAAKISDDFFSHRPGF